MTLSDTLGVIGLILTVIFGIWGIVVAVKKRYPGKLTFVEENAIGLFNSIIKNFPEIKIQYDDKPISEQMVYLKASFINTGTIDLSTKDNSHKVKINLCNDFKWINGKITSHSNEVICDLVNNEKELILDFDLLRTNEYIQFEAFAEITNSTKPAQTFRKALNFNHRIPNTGKVDKLMYLNEEQIKDKRYEFRKNAVFMTLFLLLLLIFTAYSFFTKSTDIEYVYKPEKIEYIVKVSSIGSDKVKMTEGDFEEIMKLDKFNELKTIKARIKKPTLWEYFKKNAFLLLYVIMYFSFMIPEYRGIYKDKKIKKIIENT